MSENDPHRAVLAPDRTPEHRRYLLLARVATDLATGTRTIEELGSRLMSRVDAPPTMNLARPTAVPGGSDASNAGPGDAFGPHGGIIPAP